MGADFNLLNVDLGTRKSRIVTISPQSISDYIGGRGLGAHLLYSKGKHLGDPLSPDTPLIITPGALAGTGAPSSSRTSLTSISPLTGTIFESNSGGRAGIMLKRAGFAALWIEGRAEAPVALVVDEGGVRFVDASHLAGLGNKDTRRILLADEGEKHSVLSIGPAGERGSLIANVCHDGRFFGRGGVGALFGSKNLKAISFYGDAQIPIADKDSFAFIVGEAKKLIAAHPITSKGLPQFGTAVLMNVMNCKEALPVRNFRESSFEGASKISGEAVKDNILTGRHSCYGCQIACGRTVKVDGVEVEGPEFETLWAFGAALGLSDLEGVVRLNARANDMGIDTISTGSTIAAAKELFDLGKLDWDPLEGGLGGLLNLVDEMALGAGRGAELGDGSRVFSERKGQAGVSMTVKGMELPAYDPRGCQGQGLAYATSTRGGCHLRAYMIAPEILAAPKLVDRFSSSGKAGLVIVSQNLNAAVDSLGMCRFTSFALKDDYYARLLRAATGRDIDGQGLMSAGERIYNVERLANIERGFTREDDTLPKRLLEEPHRTGASKGRVVSLNEMLDEYYRFRGWDSEGRPTLAKLDLLGLGRG
ncbi:MAG: aldehyde ferredoxin oxidoreductase [Deltaproteobacteria bacterium]|nr:MAG: aldehyde ferredoxin oxidoreductase [Deltaproteobacteria bacterium]